MYREVLGQDPGWIDGIVRARRSRRLPVVLSEAEVEALLTALDGVSWLRAMLLYGARLRLSECLSLRVKDADVARSEITVREGKGNKDRVTVLPTAVKEALATQLDRVRKLYEGNRQAGRARVPVPPPVPGALLLTMLPDPVLLPVTVLVVKVVEPLLQIPAPLPVRPFAPPPPRLVLLPLMMLLVATSVPALQMPPPSPPFPAMVFPSPEPPLPV